MKTMMKKCGRMRAYAGVCAAVALAALVTSCTNPGAPGGKDDIQLPEGMGAVRISFNDTVKQSRATILPGTTNTGNFLGGYELTFTAIMPGTGTTKTVTLGSGETTANITLVAGEYDLEVIAYLTTLGSDPVASYSNSSIIITAGSSQNLIVTLQPIDNQGNGTFAWTLTNGITPEAVTTAEMNITKIGTSTPLNVSLNDFKTSPAVAVAGTQSLASGYYYVDFSFTVAGITNNFRHILHVYENMTSTFTYTFSNAHFSIGMVRVTNITYTHPTPTPPTLNVTAGSGSVQTAVLGSGTLAAPYKLSNNGGSSTTNADIIEVEVTNAGSFASLEGWFMGAVVTETSGVFTLNGTSLTASSVPYQFTVTGKDTNGKPSITEIFITIVAD